MTERKTVVTLHKGVDSQRFLEDMTAKHGEGYIPNRSVELYNEKPGSVSNFDFVLPFDEAEQLRHDPRVRGVRWGTKKECGYTLENNVIEPSKSYSRGSAVPPPEGSSNWGLIECRYPTTQYETFNTDLEASFEYTLAGKGVDLVIQDNGIEMNHPEFRFPGTVDSRIVPVDWPVEAGLDGQFQQDPRYYSYSSRGHGTHVASIAAGNYYGWAKEATIYNQIVLEHPYALTPSQGFECLRGWHLAKGNNRPTIVNMSWSYYKEWNIQFYRYRGTTYNTSVKDVNKGMLGTRHPINVLSVDSDIEDCLAAGIIMVTAAGNDNIYIDEMGGVDWNNYYEDPNLFDAFYWHRGGTPAGTAGLITVGNVDSFWFPDIRGERKQQGSSKGPGVDIYAPGTNINGALSQNTDFGEYSFDYPVDTDWRAGRLTGTSMASPQVTGILATYLARNPGLTQEEARRWLIDNAVEGRLYDDTSGNDGTDYQSFTALMNAPNRYLQTPYTGGRVARLSGDLSYDI